MIIGSTRFESKISKSNIPCGKIKASGSNIPRSLADGLNIGGDDTVSFEIIYFRELSCYVKEGSPTLIVCL